MFSPSPTSPTMRVGIYRTSSIGDVVLATACIDLLTQLAVSSEITWIGRQPSLGLVAAAYPSVRCIEIGRTEGLNALLQTAAQLKDLHFLIDLQTNIRSRMLGQALSHSYKIPVFSCHKAQFHRNRLVMEARIRGRRSALPDRALQPPMRQLEMMCDALQRGLENHLPVEMMGRAVDASPRPRLPTFGEDMTRPWQKELRYGCWLAVSPGAAHPTKQAPVELFKDVIERVLQMEDPKYQSQAPLGLIFLGDEKDRDTARLLMDQLNWQGPLLNLAGKLSLWETTLALKEAACLLSNDSALSHIAEAVDTPVAVLFGPTAEGFGFAPWMAESRAHSARLGCRPCSKHGKVPCRYGDKLCFTSIPTEPVASQIAQILLQSRCA